MADVSADIETPLDPALTEDAIYAAVRRRDPAFDGRVFYGVRTTGVYCRPSCAARPANRANMSFHPTAAAAAAAGFRACLRCRPDQIGAPDPHAAGVARACRLVETSEEAPSLDQMAQEAGLSPFHFHRVFRRLTGVTPKAFASAELASRVQRSLGDAQTVTQAIYEAGYTASSRFYAQAPGRLGMAPAAFRRGGEGEAICFAVGQTSLGAILVASTQKGVCAILMGEDADQLVRDVQDRFPHATLQGGDPAFEAMVARVVGMVEAPGVPADLPLDIRGTAFQVQVWQALRSIPAGRTASYTDIAAAIGRPGAVRAVARACASNALAVAIPCHRVVRTDGQLAGYRWGVARKRALLDREGAAA